MVMDARKAKKMSELPEGNVPEASDMAAEISSLDPGPVDDAHFEASDLDVPVSDFWSNAETVNAPTSEEATSDEPTSSDDEVSLEGDVSESPQTIKYKANGQDVELTLEEAVKKLSMVDGGAQAFSKLAEANKRIAEYESSIPEMRKKAETLDKLEEVKHDWRAILQIATGQDPDVFLADVMRKQRINETGSDAEKHQLAREERVTALERKLQAQEDANEASKARDAERDRTSEQTALKSLLDGEYFKHKLDMGDDVRSNSANELLWQHGQRQMTKYVKKYQNDPRFKELLPKMAQQSFKDAAGILQNLATGSVQAEVDKAIAAKKQTAAEKAAVASTRRLQDNSFEDFKGLGIREIADRLIGKKKFSYD